ncbi:sensor domain-containing phosphodiesterase [Haliea sp.]
MDSFQSLVLDIAMTFINLPLDRIDAAVHAALGQMATFFQADRAYVFDYDFTAGTGTNTHEWCAAGIAPQIDSLQGLPLATMPDWVEVHRRGECLVVADVGSLAAGPLKRLLAAQNIQSLLTAPILCDGEVTGFVGFDAVRECRDYGEDERYLLSLFANLLANVVQRERSADILQQKTAALTLANERFQSILDGTHAAVYVADMDSHEVLFLNSHARDLVGDVVGQVCWQTMQTGQAGPCAFCSSARLLDADGNPGPPVSWEHFNPALQRWFQLHDRAIPWDDGRIVRMEIAFDISEQKAAEAALRESEQRYRRLFDQSRDALMVVTPPDWAFVACNSAALDLFGVADEAAFTRLTLVDLSPPLQPDGSPSNEWALAHLASAMAAGSALFEWQHQRLDGQQLSCSVLLNRTEWFGQAAIQGTVRDISAQKQVETALREQSDALHRTNARLKRIAHFDTVTDLPNRNLLADRLQQAMAQAHRHNTCIAIAYLDLDGFKDINDRYGHDVGDRMLRALAQHMNGALRAGDTLARLGGDEFVVVLVDQDTNPQSCEPVIARLLEASAETVTIDGHALQVSASIGVTFYPQHEEIDADQLLRQADQAMYLSKVEGKNRFHVFDTAFHRAREGHNRQLEEIRQALSKSEFVLFYQPKVNMRTGQVVGAEALVRWQHPRQGLLLPDAFLPFIENHALSLALGRWVIDAALTQIAAWCRSGLTLPVSVNVSASQLQQDSFVQDLQARLRKQPEVAPELLELEITETRALDDIEHASSVMAACDAMGVKFALDDFGTGYSSMMYLKRLPARTLKIDRSFVHDMLVDEDDMAILRGILGLASAFRREVLAEGVETEAHGLKLLELGCELAQGFGIARPMPATGIAEWLAAWRPPASWLRSQDT